MASSAPYADADGVHWGDDLTIEDFTHYRHPRRPDAGDYRELTVKVGKNKLKVLVSPTSRVVRVWKNGRELK